MEINKRIADFKKELTRTWKHTAQQMKQEVIKYISLRYRSMEVHFENKNETRDIYTQEKDEPHLNKIENKQGSA